MLHSTITEQEKEFYLEESNSHITKYSWLWELDDFKNNARRLPGEKYNTPATLRLINQDGQAKSWNLEFYPDGYKNTNYKKLCFLVWRDQFPRDDVKPSIQLSILDREMNKVKTAPCKEYRKTFQGNNFIVPHEYLASPMELNTILDPAGNILSNNKLRILIEFDISVKYSTLLTRLPSGDIPDTECRRPSSSTLQDGLSKYLANDTFSDVVLEVKGVEFKAHKLLLSAQSLVFATMFEQTGMTEAMENRVKIDDIEPDVAKQMLEFIYTDKAPSKIGDFTEQLIAAAHKYQMERLTRKCERILIEKISLENAVVTFIFADKYNLEILKKSVLGFIKRNPSLLETERFQDLERGNSELAFEIYHEMMSVKRRRTDAGPSQEN